MSVVVWTIPSAVVRAYTEVWVTYSGAPDTVLVPETEGVIVRASPLASTVTHILRGLWRGASSASDEAHVQRHAARASSRGRNRIMAAAGYRITGEGPGPEGVLWWQVSTVLNLKGGLLNPLERQTTWADRPFEIGETCSGQRPKGAGAIPSYQAYHPGHIDASNQAKAISARARSR